MASRRWTRLVVLALGLGASLAALFLQGAGWLAGPEFVLTDFLMRLRGPQPVDSRLVICDIDPGSIDRYGRWPWSRALMARLVKGLTEQGPRVIAFDMVFAEPSRVDERVDLSGEDEELAQALAAAGNVVLGFFFRSRPPSSTSGEGPFRVDPQALPGAAFEQVLGMPEAFPIPRQQDAELNLPLFAQAADAQGFFSHERTLGIQRHYNLAAEYGGEYYPALALRAVERFLGEGPLKLVATGGRLQIWVGERPVLHDERGVLWVNYRGPGRRMETVSAVDLLEGRIPPETLKDRLVFVGSSEPGVGDFVTTPFGTEVPGVEVHATVADNLLNEEYIQDTPVQIFYSVLAVLLLGPLVSVLVAWIRQHLVGSVVAILLVFTWPGVCFLAFDLAGWHLWVVAPMVAGVLSLVTSLRYQVGFVEARARQIKRVFERYVSQAVVEEMLQDPERVKLGGERREMTVLFSDIRGFTNISERLDSEQVVRILNEFFTPMTRLVLEAGGTLDKYMGDALMAFFGAPTRQPDHAARACRAALAMQQELVALNRRWREEGRLPDGAGLGIGIGLNSGEMSVGNMGSETIFDYTVIGDNVNLGSRIEGLNKLYGTEVLASQYTVEMAGDGFLFRELDRVRVKGKKVPVAIYQVLAEEPAPATHRELAEHFAEGLEAYRGREFAAALEIFSALLRDFPGDGPSELYRQRCQGYLEVPPAPEWDGVEVLTAK